MSGFGKKLIKSNKFNQHEFLPYLAIIVSYLYSLFFSVVSLTLGQPQLANATMMLVFASISIITMVSFFLCTFRSMRKSELAACTLIVYILLNMYTTSVVNGGWSIGAKDNFLEFGVKALPAILVGLLISRYHLLHEMVQVIDYFLLVTGLGFLKVLYQGVFSGVSRAQMLPVFGMDYQGISYFSAYMFILNLYMIVLGWKELRSSKRKTRKFQILRIFIAAVQFTVSLYSGGRGGFVLILASILAVFLYEIIINKKWIGIVYGLITMVALFFILDYLSAYNQLFKAGLERIFDFIGPGGINWSGTSGRDVVYQRAINLILERPVFGYGFSGGTYNGVLSTHNLFLEILVDGGLVYLCIWIFMLINFAQKLLRKIKINSEYVLIAAIFLGDFVNLTFSTIYWRSTAIWFVLAFILSEKKGKNINEKNRYAELS